MLSDATQLGTLLERYRSYLTLIARIELKGRLSRKIDPEDVVQETLLGAAANAEKYDGTTDDDLIRWLRGILTHKLHDAQRRYFSQKRNAAREHSLEASLEQSSARMEAFIPADQSSPSQRASKNEQLILLADALYNLPEAEREVIELHKLKGLTLREAASVMEKTEGSVTGLLRRGLARLRTNLNTND